MKKFIFFKLIFIVISLLCLYCNKANSHEIIPPGTYKGIYSITHYYNSDSAFEESGPATFIFTNTSYFCEGEKYLLPPTGGGEYFIIGETMILNDMIPHTAEFDHTLILDGEFYYWFDGYNLRLEQLDAVHHRFHLFFPVTGD